MVTLRHTLLALALAVSAIAAMVDWPGAAVVETGAGVDVATRRPSARVPSAVEDAAPASAIPQGPRFRVSTGDLFVARPPLVVAVPAIAASAPVVPRAPPLPFVYQGKSLEDSGVVVFVNQGSRTLLLRKGDVLPNYRVEDVNPSRMTVLYLPLQEIQTLNFGSAD